MNDTKEIEKITKSKVAELTNSKELVFRFMSLNELKIIIRSSEFTTKEASNAKIKFDCFIDKNYEN